MVSAISPTERAISFRHWSNALVTPKMRQPNETQCRQKRLFQSRQREVHHAGKRQPSGPISRHSVRHRQARQTDGAGRHRPLDRHLEAQCAVSARCRARDLLRLHGCARGQPLSASVHLSQGRAREGRLCRQSPGGASARRRAAMGAGGPEQEHGLGRRHHPRRRDDQEVRRARQADRGRDGVHADGCRQGARGCVSRQRDQGRAVRARAAARGEIIG